METILERHHELSSIMGSAFTKVRAITTQDGRRVFDIVNNFDRTVMKSQLCYWNSSQDFKVETYGVKNPYEHIFLLELDKMVNPSSINPFQYTSAWLIHKPLSLKSFVYGNITVVNPQRDYSYDYEIYRNYEAKYGVGKCHIGPNFIEHKIVSFESDEVVARINHHYGKKYVTVSMNPNILLSDKITFISLSIMLLLSFGF